MPLFHVVYVIVSKLDRNKSLIASPPFLSQARKAVPCHIEGLSCGRPCARPLTCGRHKCAKPCHVAPCVQGQADGQEVEVDPAVSCGQKCGRRREACGHACAAVCHDGPCPETSCKEKVGRAGKKPPGIQSIVAITA